MAKLILNGSEMNEDILENDSHFYEFMRDFFADKDRVKVEISGMTRDEMERYYEVMRDIQAETGYDKTLEYQTVHNPNRPDFLCKLSVRKMYVRKNRKKVSTGREG